MNTVSKSLSQPSRSVWVPSLKDPSGDPDYPNVGDPGHWETTPPYGTYFEEIVPNSVVYREQKWKSFEHFRTEMSTSPAVPGQLYRTTHWVSSGGVALGHYHQTVLSDVTDGYPYYDGSGLLRSPYGDLGDQSVGLPKFYDKVEGGSFIPDPADVDLLVKRSLGIMLPRVKEELSLLNSIYELKDFKNLPRQIAQARSFKSLLSNAKVTTKKKLRELARQGAGGYLQYAFNIRPLVDDVIGIYQSLVRNEARLNRLISESGRVHTRHFSYVWSEFADSVEAGDYSGYLRSPIGDPHQMESVSIERTARYVPSVFHAEIEFNYNFTQYQIEHARILGLLDSFGINLNPSIIWNALPWTFVVDWLIGVNQWLDNHKSQNMEPTINIHRYLWSIKRGREIVMQKVLRTFPTLPSGPPHYSQTTNLPACRQLAYKRVVGLPPQSSIIESSGLSSKEFSLGAAIVIARRRPRSRKTNRVIQQLLSNARQVR